MAAFTQTILLLLTLTIAIEASIEAFGLPKKFMASNHGIERIRLGTFLKIKDLNSTRDELITDSPLIRLAIRPSNKAKEDEDEDPENPPADSPMTRIRRQRQIDSEDLETAESIVFRPLFVYRQQVAERNRAQRSKNPIYGSYQYGPTKSPGH
ncbi:uncharacterized protein LOC141524215 [Cotesia typhae]|uniref:uncharacterized protein LOC141524215 n=1 Tax=Cotesia typhae TaxID=2053667 RepID=UPI003D689396